MHGLWIVPAYCLITGTIGFYADITYSVHTEQENYILEAAIFAIALLLGRFIFRFFFSKNPVLFSQYNCNISDNHNSIGTGNAWPVRRSWDSSIFVSYRLVQNHNTSACQNRFWWSFILFFSITMPISVYFFWKTNFRLNCKTARQTYRLPLDLAVGLCYIYGIKRREEPLWNGT